MLDFEAHEDDRTYRWVIGTVHYELENTNATQVQVGPISNLNKPTVVIETIGQLRERLLQEGVLKDDLPFSSTNCPPGYVEETTASLE